MQKRRLTRLVLVLVLASAAGLAGCSSGNKAGNGATNPPSTLGQ